VRRIRDRLLEILFERYCTVRGRLEASRDFSSFVEEGGENLRLFALYEAVSEAHGPDWRRWPASLQDPHAPGAVSFATQNEERVGFHCWLQWIADRQLAGAHKKAMAAGMALGLYLDIPVGSRPGGAESWAQPEAIASGVSLGAPPDAFSPQGQNWNLAPYSPEGLRRMQYHPISRMLRAAMRHAGMVRIDHALGLSRSFWICESGSASGYVRYPLEALLAVIAIEAERSRTIVIGEDLGLVAPEFREKLQHAGLFGCAVMQFERDREGRFHDPRAWRAMSLGSFGTHDTPTFEGFRQARDIEWGRRLSRGSLEDPAEVKARRHRALARLFGSMGIGEASAGDDAPSCVDTMHDALARSGSSIVAAQLDDVLGAVEQQNLPGTINEHPNWRRRCRLPVEKLAGAQSLSRLGKIMGGSGRGGTSGPDRRRKKRKDGP
jgi:4-alpha-glucanotransferase